MVMKLSSQMTVSCFIYLILMVMKLSSTDGSFIDLNLFYNKYQFKYEKNFAHIQLISMKNRFCGGNFIVINQKLPER